MVILENQENLGYAGGANTGIKYALSQSVQWVLIVNNDIVVSPSFYTELETALSYLPGIDIYAPLIFDYNQPSKIWHAGDRLIPLTLMTRGIDHRIIKPNRTIIPVDLVNGCAMLVNRRVFEKIGFFSTHFFMYAEEVDFVYRARLAGFKAGIATKALIWHKISLSSRDKPKTRYLKTVNQIIFYKTYAQLYQLPIMFFLSFVRLFYIAGKDIYHNQLHLITPLIKGWFYGWFISQPKK